jgi:pyruvate dehydrogenase E1 component beta subunit
MVQRCLDAASALEAEGVGCAVLDLRSLVPLDVDAIADAVRSTGRALVVHEAPMTLGMGAEIVARIVEEAFDHLEAPVLRVTGLDVPYPPAALEHVYLPSVERIAAAVRKVVAY